MSELISMCGQCFTVGMLTFVPIWFACWALKKVLYGALSWMRSA